MLKMITERINAWQKARRQARIERLTALAADLEEGMEYDLVFLHDKNFVRVRGTGQSITQIHGQIENLLAMELRVVVKPGTYFVARGNCQNMVTREGYSFRLYPASTKHVTINAACLNANLPIPEKKDRFHGVRRVSNEVARFLEASKNEDPMVIQAGVWTLTDNYSRYDVMQRLISRDNRGNTWHAITHDHCDKAKAILESLGIAHRLWHSSQEYAKKTVKYESGSYSGEFRYGEFHGHGTYSWQSGSSYEGAWKNGEPHGDGVYIYSDGSKYVGEFGEGREVGGWYYLPDGSRSWCRRGTNGELQLSSAVAASETGRRRDTALHSAAASGSFEDVRRRLEGGADPNALDNHACPAIKYSADKGHYEITALLLESGAEVDKADGNRWTPLHYAANKARLEIMQLLIEHGANVGAKNRDGDTALELAKKKDRRRNGYYVGARAEAFEYLRSVTEKRNT